MQQTAEVILQQLGGSKFVAMVGARNLAAGIVTEGPYLSMRIGANSLRASHLRIVLDEASDTYLLELLSCRGGRCVTLSKVDGLHFDQLRSTFEAKTGLRTSL